MPELVLPSEKYRASYIEALREGFVAGDETPRTPAQVSEIESNFSERVAKMQPGGPGGKITCPDGKEYDRVPDTTYWLVESDAFIGQSGLRHNLNDFLRGYGGHIGYGIRPSMQRKGYGTVILKLTLEKARDMGIDRVMVSCDPENTGSRKIIEANGGVLERTVRYDWAKGQTSIYWIGL